MNACSVNATIPRSGLDRCGERGTLRAMDPITLGFYALVCGCLSAVAPKFPKLPIRLGVGAVVGLIAASVLPELKGMLHLY